MKKKRYNRNDVETGRDLSLQDFYNTIKNGTSAPSKTRKKKISNLYEIMDEIDSLTREINEIDRELAKKYYFN